MNGTLDKTLGVLELVLTGVTVYLTLRVILGPDGMKRLCMVACKTGEDVCQGQAEVWARRADFLAAQYDKVRSVTV